MFTYYMFIISKTYIECCFAHKNNYFNEDRLFTTESLELYANFIPLVYYKKNLYGGTAILVSCPFHPGPCDSEWHGNNDPSH